MYEQLLYEVQGGVATITLNRPQVYNAINQQISLELQDALKQATKDEQVRVVVLTAAGDKAFCSGQDLKENSEVEATGAKRSLSESLHKRYNPIIRAMRSMPKPIVGRINGVAAGAGCSLALACDIIVAADTVNFIEIFINIGLVLDSGSSYFLPRAIGMAKAFEMSTMGNKVPAAEAERIGLINKAVPTDALDAAVAEYTTYYAAAPTKAIALMKKMLNRSHTSTLDEMLDYEAMCQDIASRSADFAEGTTAFREKRKPAFTGK
jgi:2-(1,2-epoxy-1,2-dihydrophenyl)acetyl-CoA isomerase